MRAAFHTDKSGHHLSAGRSSLQVWSRPVLHALIDDTMIQDRKIKSPRGCLSRPLRLQQRSITLQTQKGAVASRVLLRTLRMRRRLLQARQNSVKAHETWFQLSQHAENTCSIPSRAMESLPPLTSSLIRSLVYNFKLPTMRRPVVREMLLEGRDPKHLLEGAKLPSYSSVCIDSSTTVAASVPPGIGAGVYLDGTTLIYIYHVSGGAASSGAIGSFRGLEHFLDIPGIGANTLFCCGPLCMTCKIQDPNGIRRFLLRVIQGATKVFYCRFWSSHSVGEGEMPK